MDVDEVREALREMREHGIYQHSQTVIVCDWIMTLTAPTASEKT